MNRDFWRRETPIWRRRVGARARSNRSNQGRKMRIARFPRGDLRWRGDGRKILGVDLGFGEEEEEDFGFWREEDEDGVGRLMNGILIKKRATHGILAENCKYAIGSTLGGRLMIHKISRK